MKASKVEQNRRQRQREQSRARKAAARERGRKLVAAAKAKAAKLITAARLRAKQLLAAAAKPKAKPKRKVRIVKAKPIEAKDRSKFIAAVSRISKREKPGALLSVAVVRTEAALPKATFDRIALQLMRAGELVLHEHDFPASLSASTLEAMIQEGKRAFIGMALPSQDRNLAAQLEPEKLVLAEIKAMGATREKPIRIPALRRRLESTMAAEVFDAALGKLQRDKGIVMYRDDNNVTAEKEGAWFVAGSPRHILYLR